MLKINPAIGQMRTTIIRLIDQMRLLDQDMIRLQEKVNTVLQMKENEKKKSIELAELIDSGQQVALVSDAGYPGISDPGFRLVRECRRRRLSVIPIPGPNAAITALAASGLPTHQFLYLGFLPKKSAAAKAIKMYPIYFINNHLIINGLIKLKNISSLN